MKSKPFTIPSLGVADAEYGRLLGIRAGLITQQTDAVRAVRALEAEISSDTSKPVRPEVAALLGEAPTSKTKNIAKLRETKQLVADVEAALTEVDRRLTDAKPAANRAAVAAARPEIDRRIAALADAMRTLDAAHADLDTLCADLEAEDIQFAHVLPRPWFLMGSRDNDRPIQRYLREVAHA